MRLPVANDECRGKHHLPDGNRCLLDDNRDDNCRTADDNYHLLDENDYHLLDENHHYN